MNECLTCGKELKEEQEGFCNKKCYSKYGKDGVG